MNWPAILYIIYSMAPFITTCIKSVWPTYSLVYKCHHFIILAPRYVIGSWPKKAFRDLFEFICCGNLRQPPKRWSWKRRACHRQRGENPCKYSDLDLILPQQEMFGVPRRFCAWQHCQGNSLGYACFLNKPGRTKHKLSRWPSMTMIPENVLIDRNSDDIYMHKSWLLPENNVIFNLPIFICRHFMIVIPLCCTLNASFKCNLCKFKWILMTFDPDIRPEVKYQTCKQVDIIYIRPPHNS